MSSNEKNKTHELCSKVMNTIVWLIFLVGGMTFSWLVSNVLLNHVYVDPHSMGGDFVIKSYFNPFIVISIVLLICFVVIKIGKCKNQFLDSRKIYIVIMGCIFIVQIIVARSICFDLNKELFSDFGIIVNSAIEITNDQTYIDVNNYYKNVPYQIGILSELVGWNKILLFKGYDRDLFNTNCIILNMISIDMGIIGGYLLARKMWNVRAANLFMLISLVFLPFYTFIPYFYTDSLSLPYGIWGIFLYACSVSDSSLKDRKNKAKNVVFFFLSLVILAFGAFIKATVGIVFVGICLHMLVTKQKPLKIALFILFFIIMYIGFPKYICHIADKREWLNYQISDERGYPLELWLLMGTNENRLGAWPPEDVNEVLAYDSHDMQKQVAVSMAKTRLKEYGSADYVKFLTKKQNWMWGDGAYFGNTILATFPHKNNTLILDFFSKNYTGSAVFMYWSQCVQLFLLIMITCSFFQNTHKELSLMFVVDICLLGLLIFLCGWEARPRYLYNFTPLIILSAIDGLNFLCHRTTNLSE